MRFTERPGLLRDRRGSAYAEGVIVAFFFAIMFGAILWVHRGYASEHRVTRNVRQGVWSLALAGCEDGTDAPEVDPASSFRDQAMEIAPEIAVALDEVVIQQIEDSASHTASRPSAVGGGSRTSTDRAQTHCNTRPRHEAFPIRDQAILRFCEIHPGEQFAGGKHVMQWEAGCDPEATY